MKSGADSYSIRQVIDLSGVTEFLLRTWELRYDAFKPKRTETGRRVYTPDDVLRAKVLLDLTNRGYKIRDIAQRSLAQLKKLQESDIKKDLNAPSEHNFSDLFTFAERYEWEQVRKIIFKDSKKKDYIQRILIPLLSELGQRVLAQQVSIAQEHIISAFVKEALSSDSRFVSRKASSFRMVFASPESDFHELGLLLGSKLAAQAGHEVLYLGPNMPKRELAECCLRFKPTHLVLTSTLSKSEGAAEDILQTLHFLNHHLNKKIEIWLAGRNAKGIQVKLDRNIKVFSNFSDYEGELYE